MIKNEKQFKMARSKLDKWLHTKIQLEQKKPSGDDWLHKEQVFGVEQQIKQLRSEIDEYEKTAAGLTELPDPSLVQQIPSMLIRWRIYRHLTQRQLADLLGVHENQIQRYERENYLHASLETITRIAGILKECDQQPS